MMSCEQDRSIQGENNLPGQEDIGAVPGIGLPDKKRRQR